MNYKDYISPALLTSMKTDLKNTLLNLDADWKQHHIENTKSYYVYLHEYDHVAFHDKGTMFEKCTIKSSNKLCYAQLHILEECYSLKLNHIQRRMCTDKNERLETLKLLVVDAYFYITTRITTENKYNASTVLIQSKFNDKMKDILEL